MSGRFPSLFPFPFLIPILFWHLVPLLAQGQTEVKYFLHNHLRFTILYHKDVHTDLARIVGFEVEPFSVKHEYEAPWDKTSPILSTCNPGRMTYVTHDTPPQPVQDGMEVIFSYDVKFVVSAESPSLSANGRVTNHRLLLVCSVF